MKFVTLRADDGEDWLVVGRGEEQRGKRWYQGDGDGTSGLNMANKWMVLSKKASGKSKGEGSGKGKLPGEPAASTSGGPG